MHTLVKNLNLEVTPDNLEQGAIAIAKTIRGEWKDNCVAVKIFTDGITNRLVGCFLPSNPDDMLLIRVYGENTQLFIDRTIEIRNMKLMNEWKLSPPIYASFNNGICYGFTPGSVLTYEMASNPTISSLIAEKLAQMHSLVYKQSAKSSDGVAATPSLFRVFQKYIQLVPCSLEDKSKNQRLCNESPSIATLKEEVKFLEKLLPRSGSPVVFCHNDLLLKNIIYHPATGVTFIDFEYGDFNYQAFDIANHFCEFAGVDVFDPSRYPSEEFIHNWLRAYLTNWRKHENSELSLDDHIEVLSGQVKKFNMAAQLFWGIWALIQSQHSTLDFDFMSYAIDRINQYFVEKSKIQENGHSSTTLPAQERLTSHI